MLIALAEEVEEVTFRVTLVECVSEPLVPLMLSVELPRVDPVTIVSVELPVVVMEGGVKVGDAPEGRPETAKFTAPVNPLRGDTVTV